MLRRMGITFLAVAACWAGVSARAANVEVVLTLDLSGSIDNTELQLEVNGLKACLADLTVVPQDGSVAVGIVYYCDAAVDLLQLTPLTPAGLVTINAALDGLVSARPCAGQTNISDGLAHAQAMLNGAGSTTENDFVLLVGDGEATVGGNVQTQCDSLASDGIVVCAIAVAASTAGQAELAACAAATGGDYGNAATFNDFGPICRACFGNILAITCLSPTVCTDPGACTANVACSAIASCRTVDGTVLATTCAPPGPYALGTTPVVVTCTNADGRVFRSVCSVTVTDCLGPAITCPANVQVECSASTEPAATGSPTGVSDACGGAVTVGHADTVTPGACTGRRVITRVWTATDARNNSTSCTQTITVVDTTAPTKTTSSVWGGGAVNAQCQRTVSFSATFADNCCIGIGAADSVITAVVTSGAADVAVQAPITRTQLTATSISVSGTVLVSNLQACPTVVEVRAAVRDCCGNLANLVLGSATVTDTTPPVITCPPPITVQHGNFLCDSEALNWLNSATATDNCDGNVTITNNAPACGFPYGSTTTVTWTATDNCNNTASCSSTITVLPADRTSIDQKGSLLIYSKIELRWNAAGALTQDTFLSITNDDDTGVFVQWYFIQGDGPLAANGAERAHLGWNKSDAVIFLTPNQSIYWSAARGFNSAGGSPFTVLDPGTPPGRPDTEVAGDRVLRGYALAWAVNGQTVHEIRHNHLTGTGLLVNYQLTSAWDYLPWAYQTRCVAPEAEPLDCTLFDANGTCCTASAIPGKLDTDGFQYSFSPSLLILDFFATGSTALGTTGAGFVLDTDLTLLPVSVDLRQDGNGPVTTKAKFDIWNQNEVRFSNQERCITCWDQTLFSRYGIPRHVLRTNLQTDKGKARIDGLSSTVCANSSADALLGVAAKVLVTPPDSVNPGVTELAGSNLVGSGLQTSTIRYDIPRGPNELNRGNLFEFPVNGAAPTAGEPIRRTGANAKRDAKSGN